MALPPSFRNLSPAAIVATIGELRARIDAGFPGSSLSGVADELDRSAREIEKLTVWLARPLWWARAVVVAGGAVLLAALFGLATRIRPRLQFDDLGELLQGLEAAVNNLVFLGVALFFLSMIETRVKRSRALKSLHTLRSLAHIVDMHQLEKDPERLDDAVRGAEPPLPATQLARYLDHCGDLLTLISKLAALHAQRFDDGPTLSVVQEVEQLAHALVRNIWQKIMIVDRVRAS